MSAEESCCLGKLVNDECHINRWKNVVKCLHKIEDLAQDDVEIIKSRVPKSRNTELNSICDYHFKAYLTYYVVKKKCFDPWNKHSQGVVTRLSKIILEFSKKAYNCLKIDLSVDQEVCRDCFTKLKNEIATFEHQFEYCVDPFNKRNHNQIPVDLTCLEESAVNYLKGSMNLEYTISHQICITCNNQLKSLISEVSEKSKKIEVIDISRENSESQTESEKLSLEKKETSGSDFVTVSQGKRELDSMLSTFGLPPFKRQKMNNNVVVKNGVAIIQTMVDKVSEVFKDVNEVKLPDLK